MILRNSNRSLRGKNDKSQSTEIYRGSFFLDHSFCSEYLFRDWEAFLDFIYEEGCRVSSILWWEHCKKNFQHGYGGYSDPDDREWMYSETWLHEDGFEEKSLADIKAYIHETRAHGLILGDKYISHDLVPSFYLADEQTPVCRDIAGSGICKGNSK